MTPNAGELLKAALALPAAEREALADQLWASLDEVNAEADLTEEEFAAELARRAAELKADPSLGIPWDEVRNLR